MNFVNIGYFFDTSDHKEIELFRGGYFLLLFLTFPDEF